MCLTPAVEQATTTSLALGITVLFVTKGEGTAFGYRKPDAVLTPAVTFSALKEGSHTAQESSSVMSRSYWELLILWRGKRGQKGAGRMPPGKRS